MAHYPLVWFQQVFVFYYKYSKCVVLKCVSVWLFRRYLYELWTTWAYSRCCGSPSAHMYKSLVIVLFCCPIWNLKPSWKFHGDCCWFLLFKTKWTKYLLCLGNNLSTIYSSFSFSLGDLSFDDHLLSLILHIICLSPSSTLYIDLLCGISYHSLYFFISVIFLGYVCLPERPCTIIHIYPFMLQYQFMINRKDSVTTSLIEMKCGKIINDLMICK